jgi:hypothetical protein
LIAVGSKLGATLSPAPSSQESPDVSDEAPAASESQSLNGDMAERIVVHTDEMAWTPSPAGHVLRKRVHLVGGSESGQVTSVVQYLPGAKFPEHPHPEGEEIFVLSGTFSDQSGDALPGTHLPGTGVIGPGCQNA